MASESGGSMKKKSIKYSSMKQPPLIKQLKGILSEYPDGGQILKELIQNAEDAGAKEVKILHDKRRINQDITDQRETTSVNTKFFKGPALCVYNDAVFTEDDWEGIQMIYSSVKEEDPLKVGRFGLGFKSVFHITDFPCVISGDRVLMIDPQQPTNNVNATLDLCDLSDYGEDVFDVDAFWVALDDTFGLSRRTLQENGFQGTIFWFPLREKPSDLSETLYNETKVKNLFDSFSLEESNVLLFLKNIEKISLHSRDMDKTIIETLKLEIEDKDGIVRRSRQSFKDQINEQGLSSEGKDIHSTLHMVICKSSMDTLERQEWLVVNYFVRESASNDFLKLIHDKNLGYSPYVGVATPLKGMEEDFEGHVFCFLPLPKEGERLTGLPVHVNGFFALSQNRHHMKWGTDEQEGKPIDDKSILWNKALIEEALPKAYELLVLEVIEMAKKNRNDEILVKAVYNTMPTCRTTSRRTHKRWMSLESKLYGYLGERNIVYAKHTNEWMKLAEAYFATFRTMSGNDNDTVIQESVLKCLAKVDVKHADVPLSFFDTLQEHFPFVKEKDLTPELLASKMKQRHEYKELADSDKFNVTKYLLYCDNFSNIQDIELLLLASNKWVSFNRYNEPVSLCSDAAVKMFPGSENRFVMESTKLGPQLTEKMERICQLGNFQVRRLAIDETRRLLTETLRYHLGSNVQLTKASSLSYHWLNNVWNVITDKDMVNDFKDITIVPMLVKGSWTDPEVIELVSLSDYVILKEAKAFGECCLNDGLTNCLKALKVKVLPSLPEWIKFESIQNYVKQPTKQGITSLFEEMFLRMGEKVVSEFNQASGFNCQIRESVLQFASALVHLQPNVVKFFRKLNLFKAVNSMEDGGHYASVENVRRCIPEIINFPAGVNLPFVCIKIDSQDQNFISQLGIEIVSLDSLILNTIKSLQASKNEHQVQTFMNYFMENISLFENNKSICDNAATLPFLKVGKEIRRPSGVFDPSSQSLKMLLIGESYFPERFPEYSSQELRALRRLGMKGEDKVDANVMLKVANTLSAWQRNKVRSDDLLKKSTAFMEVLMHRPDLLDQYCSGMSTLCNVLMPIQCIPVNQKPPEDYPNGMPWFADTDSVVLCKPNEAKHIDWSLFAGSQLPMVSCSLQYKVARQFKWNEPPKTEIVLRQLTFIRQHYDVKNKPDYIRATQKIYKHLHSLKNTVPFLHLLKDEQVIWTGESFEKPSNVIVTSREADLDLRPYFYYIPEEFRDINNLFLYLGCNSEQNNEILLRTLRDIKVKHESAEKITPVSISRDSVIVLEILKCLARKQKENGLDVEESKRLMLVENESSERLSLQYVSVCIFDEDQDELDSEEEKMFFVVHHSIPGSVAKDLGVKSVKKKTIIGATEDFGVEEWGLHESLTTRIRTLLKEGYKDGLSVPKEVVQNADDSGATIVKFLLDDRQNDDAKRTEKLLSSDLKDCQGPALWVFNDSMFTEQDLNNITKLNGATKAECKDKIGKFGLGFCSVYNLTDVPSFISGKDMIIFDPHETYLSEARQSRGTGLRIKLSNRNIVRRNIDQFKPYDSVFGCDICDKSFTGFSGTLFRLPLRTESQAARSDISSEAYTKDEVTALLKQFVENAGNVLLFTQNVKKLQVYYLPRNETDPSRAKLLFNIEKQVSQMSSGTQAVPVQVGPAQSILKRMPTILKNGDTFAEIQNVIVSQTLYENTLLHLRDNMYSSSFETSWIVSWALGIKESLALSKVMSKEGAVPLSSVAIPIDDKNNNKPLMLEDVQAGYYKKGHLFCFLPLPITTDLQIYINGCFSVSSDRRGLVCSTEDDKRKGHDITWNQMLMEDSVVQSFVNLLSYLSKRCSERYIYHSLWPLSRCDDIKPFSQSFYRKLITDNLKLFKGEHSWLSFDEVVYLDPIVRSNNIIGNIAYDFLVSVPITSGKQIIEMPEHILSSLQQCTCQGSSVIKDSMINEETLMLHLLSSLDSPFWQNQLQNRNRMLFYALQSKSKRVLEKLQATKCIPTEPNNNLCKPKELVSPSSDIAEMFDVADERFPLQSDEFPCRQILLRLIELGMNNKFLPTDMLLNRCKTIDGLISKCGSCAQDRCIGVIKYCGRYDVIQKLEKDQGTINELQKTILLPVLNSPDNWRFTWKADSLRDHVSNVKCAAHLKEKETTIRFENPTTLFRESCSISNGSASMFVHESFLKLKCALPETLFKLLGVKSQLSLELLLKQLTILSEKYTHADDQFSSLDMISKAVYGKLGDLIGDKSEKEIKQMQCFKNLEETPLIVIGKELVPPRKVSFHVKSECTPELYHLKKVDYRREKLFKALGVKENFTVEYLASILQRKYAEYDQRVCTDIELVVCLLLNLCESMNIEKLSFSDLSNTEETIVAPDLEGILRPTYDLVIEDPEYKSSESIHILHGNVPPDIGRALGVKSWQRKIVELFSSGFFEPFGQNESLVTRLTGILEDYPCDSSIMKELLQNADDAGATEIHFIKNYTSYPPDKVFGNGDLQGPSLCVFNDSFFTENDFNGIKNLGIGSKREDPSKTGQYGIGFNAVYHLTDTPSFLTKGPGLGTGGQICIFDPTMACLEGHATSENPGIRCDADKMKQSFPDMLLGYPIVSSMETSGQGTIFRLPLRKSKSDISKNIMTPGKMDKIIETFKTDMFDSLLFLKCVKCIKVLRLHNGKLLEEFSVDTKLSDEDEISRKQYFSNIKKVLKANTGSQHQNLCMDPIEASYKVNIEFNQERNESWLIVNRFGIKQTKEQYSNVITALKTNEIGLTPAVSIAIPWPDMNLHNVSGTHKMENKEKKFSGKAFCFLPLPIFTGLPFHINGHFALDKARTKLWGEGDRKLWNDFVIAELLSRTCISAIHYMKDEFVCKHHRELLDEKLRIFIFGKYHGLFPQWEKCSDNIWKKFISSFYQIIIEEERKLFPSIGLGHYGRGQVDDTIKEFTIDWVSLSTSEDDFNGTFNVVSRQITGQYSYTGNHPFNRTDATYVESTLKRIGMKVIETPLWVSSSISQSGIKYIPYCSPESVVTFLKTFAESKIDTCNIGKINCPIGETTISNMMALQTLLKYIYKDSKLIEKIDGLPLCLTNDGVLKVFSKMTPVFCSRMCNILTGSADMFIHNEILPLVNVKEYYDAGVIKMFVVNDFHSIIAKTFDQSVLANGNHVMWDKQNGVPSKPNVIEDVLLFILDNSTEYVGEYISFSRKVFHSNMHLFNSWSFLPSVHCFGTKEIFELVPVCQANHMFTNSYIDWHATLCTTIEKLNIPCLDKSCFSKGNEKLRYEVEKLLPSTERPVQLLECLCFYKSRLRSNTLTLQEGISVLNFFDDKIEQMKKQYNENSLRQMLGCLPLYVSHQQECVSIDGFNDVVVLPKGIPSAGINDWAQATGILLLMDTEKLLNLYKFLRFPRKTEIEVYIEKILPNFQRFPRIAWKAHIEYLKNVILKTSFGEFDQKQQYVVEQLKSIAFVSVFGEDKKVNQLYDHLDSVFSCMLTESDFLPEEYRGHNWRNFLEKLGLIMKPSGELLLDFAHRIETTINNPINKTTERQSDALVCCLFDNEWTERILNEIKNIRFVVPKKVDEERKRIAQQPANGELLVSFLDTVSYEYMDHCWSSQILISSLPPTKKMITSLGIRQSPPIDRIIQHCQNVSVVFKADLEKDVISISTIFIRKQMELFYREFQKSFDETMKQNFQVTPIVFQPDDNKMLLVQQIVINLTGEEEVRPYLYKLPNCFGPYDALFQKLGSHQTPLCSDYALVLAEIKQQFKDEPLPFNILKCVKKALENIVKLAEKELNPMADLKKIFMPDRDRVLQPSKMLTVSNNNDIEERLEGKQQILFFVGFKELDIDIVSDPALPFEKWPALLRPDILMEEIIEEISTDDIVEKNCIKAQQIECSLQSFPVVQGILRILKDQLREDNGIFNKSVENEIMQCLRNVCVTKVSGLKTFLKYKGQKIEGTDLNATCFIQRHSSKDNADEVEFTYYELYFQDETNDKLLDSLLDDKHGILKLIDLCTNKKLDKDRILYLSQILHMLDNTSEISRRLDKLKIDAYDLPATWKGSIFPRPGTYVEEKFHAFIEQSISPFKPYEYSYVALEVEDENDLNDPVYMYAHINNENKRCHGSSLLDITYNVNVGCNDDLVVVPIYRLYRFKPKNQEEVTDLVVYDIEPIGSIPIDENFRRVRQILKEAWKLDDTGRKRITRRLWMQWHPDRNREHREYAGRLFNYINEVIVKLENNELIDDDITHDTGKTPTDMSGSKFGSASDAVYKRGSSLAAYFHDNREDYMRETRTGNFAHHKAEKAVVRHIGEAKRWHRQAVKDFKAAKSNMSSGEEDQSFNWVCYKCHQASEKALKAAWFAKNANVARRKDHSLRNIASGLDDGLLSEATSLEAITGDYSYMRYPDAVLGQHQIPSEMFDGQKAEKAIEITKSILDTTGELID